MNRYESKHPLMGKEVRLFIEGNSKCLNTYGCSYIVEHICDSHVVLSTKEEEENPTLVLFPMNKIDQLDTIGCCDAPTDEEQVPFVAIGNGEPVPEHLKHLVDKVKKTKETNDKDVPHD